MKGGVNNAKQWIKGSTTAKENNINKQDKKGGAGVVGRVPPHPAISDGYPA